MTLLGYWVGVGIINIEKLWKSTRPTDCGRINWCWW